MRARQGREADTHDEVWSRSPDSDLDNVGRADGHSQTQQPVACIGKKTDQRLRHSTEGQERAYNPSHPECQSQTLRYTASETRRMMAAGARSEIRYSARDETRVCV